MLNSTPPSVLLLGVPGGEETGRMKSEGTGQTGTMNRKADKERSERASKKQT